LSDRITVVRNPNCLHDSAHLCRLDPHEVADPVQRSKAISVPAITSIRKPLRAEPDEHQHERRAAGRGSGDGRRYARDREEDGDPRHVRIAVASIATAVSLPSQPDELALSSGCRASSRPDDPLEHPGRDDRRQDDN